LKKKNSGKSNNQNVTAGDKPAESTVAANTDAVAEAADDTGSSTATGAIRPDRLSDQAVCGTEREIAEDIYGDMGISRRHRFSSDDLRKAMTLAMALCIVVLFYLLLGKIGIFVSAVKKLLSAMSAIIVGAIIAFLLNPVVNKLRLWFVPFMTKHTRWKPRTIKKVSDISSIILAMLGFLAILTAIIIMIVPQLKDSIIKLYTNLETYSQNIQSFVNKLLKNYPEVEEVASEYLNDINTTIMNLFSEKVIPNIDTIVSKVSEGIVGGVKFILNFIVGIIAAIYILLSKEVFAAQGKKVIYAVFDKKNGNHVLKAVEYVDSVFGGFIIGKIIDSMIIGVICAIFCGIVNMPYAVLISVIVGVTNIIPFFGPFIGAIPSAFLVLVESPKMCIVFIIFIIILQQLDGNVIGPLILGDSTGLSGFWVLFAILVGGNLFGFVGMVIGVPLFACIYTLLTLLLRDGLNRRGLDNTTEYFVALRGFDDDGNPIRGPKPKHESARARKKRRRSQVKLNHSMEVVKGKVPHINKKSEDDEQGDKK